MIPLYHYLIYTFNSTSYMSLSFRPSVVLLGITQPYDTINKNRELHPIYHPTIPPSNPPIPSSSDCLSGLFLGIDPNNRPNTDPVNTTSPEGQRVQFPNCIQSDIGNVVEEDPKEVGSLFGPGGSSKLRPASLGCSDSSLTFSTAYMIIFPIWLTSF